MDDDLHSLESELSRLRPAGLRRVFADRMEGALDRRRLAPFRWIWLSLPLAAAVAFALGWPRRTAAPQQPAPAASFEPVDVRDVLVSARDEGYVTLADGRPARRLIEAHLDTIVWRNPKSAASIKWSVPREELKIVPIVYQ
jgi:hypothetical protein